MSPTDSLHFLEAVRGLPEQLATAVAATELELTAAQRDELAGMFP